MLLKPEIKEKWLKALRSGEYKQTTSVLASKKGYVMNKEVKVKWLEALRSGQYQQGTGQLKTGTRFCCLGVLCDIYGQENNLDWSDEYPECLVGMTPATYLPQEAAFWSELPDKEEKVLAKMNDEARADFNTIADYIEANL